MLRLTPWLARALLLTLLLTGCLTVRVGTQAIGDNTGVLDVTWTAPTTNTDASPLNDLASYRVYYALAPATACPGATFAIVNSQTTTPGPNTTVTTTLQNLTVGSTYTVQITAVDTSGLESGCSTPASAPARANPTPVTNTLTTTKTGNGQGTLTSNPAGISCGAICSASFAATTTVTMTGQPSSGSLFTGWSGDCTGAAASCSVPMSANHAVTGSFALSHTLAVTKTGAGSGKVVSTPSGLDCGSTCSQAFPDSATVSLTATPDPGSMFTGFSGACSGTVCSVAMAQDQAVTATFAPAYTLTLNFAGSGAVDVTDSTGILHCHTTAPSSTPCVGVFNPGTTTTITVSPTPPATFSSWAGDCTGTTPVCTVVMSTNRTATATVATPPPAGTLNFGETTAGTLSVGNLGAQLNTLAATVPGAGTLQSLSTHAQAVSGRIELALYTDAGGRPGTRLATTGLQNPTVGWNTWPVPAVALTAGAYWLAIGYESNGQGNTFVVGGSSPYWWAWPMPATWPTAAPNGTMTNHPSLYGTLTTTAPPAKNGTIQNPQLQFTTP